MLKKSMAFLLCAAMVIMSLGFTVSADETAAVNEKLMYSIAGEKYNVSAWDNSGYATQLDGGLAFANGKNITRYIATYTERNVVTYNFALKIPSTVNGALTTIKDGIHFQLRSRGYTGNVFLDNGKLFFRYGYGSNKIESPNDVYDTWHRFSMTVDYNNKVTLTAYGNDGAADAVGTFPGKPDTSYGEKENDKTYILCTPRSDGADKTAQIIIKDLTAAYLNSEVVSANIEDGATNVDASNIQLTFNGNAEIDKIKEAIKIKDASGNEVSDATVNVSAVANDNKTAKISVSGLEIGAKYTLAIAKDSDVGEFGGMFADYALNFKTSVETKLYVWNDRTDKGTNWEAGQSDISEADGVLTFTNGSGAKYKAPMHPRSDKAVVFDFAVKIPSEVNGNKTTYKENAQIFCIRHRAIWGKLKLLDGKMTFSIGDSWKAKVTAPDSGYDTWNRFRMTVDYTNGQATLTAYGANGAIDTNSTPHQKLTVDDKTGDNASTYIYVFDNVETGSANGTAQLMLKDFNISEVQSEVVSANIEDGATNVDASNIQLTFNGNAEIDKIKDAIKIKDASGNEVSGATVNVSAVEDDYKTAKVSVSGLEIGTKYTLAIAKDSDVGEFGGLYSDYALSFTTIASNVVYNMAKETFAQSKWQDNDYVTQLDGGIAFGNGKTALRYIATYKDYNVVTYNFALKIPSTVNGESTTIKDGQHFTIRHRGYFGNVELKENKLIFNSGNLNIVSPNDVYDTWHRFSMTVDYDSKITLTAYGNDGAKDVVGIAYKKHAENEDDTTYIFGKPQSSGTEANTAQIIFKDLTIAYSTSAVVSANIEDGATNVDASNIQLTFNGNAEIDKIKEAIKIKDADGNDVSYATVNVSAVEDDSKTAKISIDGLRGNTAYTLAIAEGSDVGEFGGMASDYAISFAKALSGKVMVYDLAITGSQASAYVYNDSGEAKNYVLIVAAYNENDALVGVNADESGTLNSGEGIAVSDSVTADGTAYYKAFVWDSISGGVPYTASCSTKVQ